MLNIHWKDWYWSWSSNTLATWYVEPTHWKTPWCWERLRAGGEGGTEDEIVGWHHWLNGHELEQTPGDGERWGSLACCNSWGQKKSDMTERLNNNHNFKEINMKFWDEQRGLWTGLSACDSISHWVTCTKHMLCSCTRQITVGTPISLQPDLGEWVPAQKGDVQTKT